MISYAVLCIRVAEVVYGHQKWKDIILAAEGNLLRKFSPNVSFVVKRCLGLEADR